MDVETFEATPTTEEPPRWAVLERRVIDRIDDAVDLIMERYLDDDGSAMWPPSDDYVGIDAVDDVYEGFWNWPLYYTLGGDRKVFEYAFDEFEAITEQFAAVPTGLGHPQIVREYQQGHDWFHQSEGYLLFYHLCLAEPHNDRLRQLATRYAGFYLNEVDGVPDNYDPNHDLLYCPMNGSKGPAYHNFSDDVPPPMYHAHSETRIPWQYSAWKEHYGLPYYDLHGIDTVEDLKDEEKARRMGEAIRDRCAESDTPQNLGVTGLVANAFLLTGEERFRDWVAQYVDAWHQRARTNNGLLPDNVDHEGVIGGATGSWYGGWYGWSWPHGWRSLGAALIGSAEVAVTLTGNEHHLELPRSQLAHLVERGRPGDDGFELPTRYADAGELPRERGQDPDAEAGWFQYRRERPGFPAHIWYCSRQDEDRARLDQLAPPGGDLRADGKGLGGNDANWADYVDGSDEAYPERMLEHTLDLIEERVEFVRTDDQDPAHYGDWYLQERNPVVTEGLVQLTTGAPQVIYNGGLTVATVRYFDPDRPRPGLPPGVAALVVDLAEDAVTLRLVNTMACERTVLIQAGGYAEHTFTAVETSPLGEDPNQHVGRSVADTIFSVSLPGGGGITIDADIRRFDNDPTYAFPWARR